MGTRGGRYAAGKAAEKATHELLKQLGLFPPLLETRKAIVQAFDERGISVVRSGFDAVPRSFLLGGRDYIRKNLDTLRLYEVKTCGEDRESCVPSDFRGMGFTLTGSERKNANALGDQYRFLLCNLATNEYLECTLSDFFTNERARIYETWSVHFKTGIYPSVSPSIGRGK